jgi:acetyltransferase-like isoleucine patch superfamily enzyme
VSDDSARDATGRERRDAAADDRRDAATEGDGDDESLVGTRTGRHERVRSHPTPGPGNALGDWPEAKHPLRLTLNFLVVWAVRYSPSLSLKRWLLRRLGATVEEGVTFALTATPDVFWPELLTVREDAIVGYDATLLCHEFLQDEYRTGEIIVGERAMVGADTLVLPGVEIGADARVAANSLVTEDVPPGTTVAGVPARPVEE